MFCSDPPAGPAAPTSGLRQRARAALDLAAAFLTLRDDYDVDWDFPEAESDLPAERAPSPDGSAIRARADGHARRHRPPSAVPARRAGSTPPAVVPCLAPLPLRGSAAARLTADRS